MYTVDEGLGPYLPNVGASSKTLTKNTTMVWHFTMAYGADVDAPWASPDGETPGGGSPGGGTPGEGTIDDIWYKFSFTDENDKNIDGYISGLGSKLEEPSEDIYAIAAEEGAVVWKQYMLSGESWSETGVTYASNPFEDITTASISDFDDMREQDISVQAIPTIKDVKNAINETIEEIKRTFYNRVGFELQELTDKDKKMIVNGIACGVDDNMFWGVAQYITGAEQPDDDYFFMKAKCYTDAAFLSAYTVASVGSAAEAVNALKRAGLSAQMAMAASPTGAGSAVLGTATVAQLAESVVMTGVSFVTAKMAENSGNVLRNDVGKLSETKQYDIEVSLSDIEYKNKKELTAEEVNQWWFDEAGYSPPYKEETPVYEITLTEKTKFVRVYREDKGNRVRSWIMKEEQIEGLTAAQIKDKFALPIEPTHVCDVNVPANTKIRVGTAAEQPGFGGKGGSIQFDLMNKQNKNWFSIGIELP